MMTDQILQVIQSKKNDRWWLESERKVLNRYGSLFHPDNLGNLTKEEFQSFLLIKNNYHWEGIHRQQGLITLDLQRLKKALTTLLDETRPCKRDLIF